MWQYWFCFQQRMAPSHFPIPLVNLPRSFPIPLPSQRRPKHAKTLDVSTLGINRTRPFKTYVGTQHRMSPKSLRNACNNTTEPCKSLATDCRVKAWKTLSWNVSIIHIFFGGGGGGEVWSWFAPSPHVTFSVHVHFKFLGPQNENTDWYCTTCRRSLG